MFAWIGGVSTEVCRLCLSPHLSVLFLTTMSTTIIANNVVHNDHHREIHIDARGVEVTDIVKTCMTEDITPDTIPSQDLFKYIHPTVTDENEKVKIHREVQNLVQHFPLSEICRYMRQMYKEKRVYLNVKSEAMFEELHRLGLPDASTPGYSLKNFLNFFNVND